MAEVPPDGELNSEPLKYTTWVLRVSIHCEGCKRKVKRILRSVEGVYTIHVERKQHKVIVTGNVDANTLIRKLEKSGKHAELWPNVNNINYQNDEQQQQQQQNEDDQNQPDEQQQNPDNSCQQQQQQQQQNVVKEVRFATNVTSPGNDVSGNSSSGGGVAAAPGPKKKKKKKKSNSSGNSNVNNTVNNYNEPGGQPPHEQQQHCNNNGPPHPESQQQQYMGPGMGSGQGPGMGPGSGMGPGPGMPPQGNMQSNRVYEYAPVYHAPQPMCGVSYNTAYPRTYTASYYSTPSPYSYLYAYTRGGDVELSMPLDLGGPSALQPPNSFELFSDENPNACSVM